MWRVGAADGRSSIEGLLFRKPGFERGYPLAQGSLDRDLLHKASEQVFHGVEANVKRIEPGIEGAHFSTQGLFGVVDAVFKAIAHVVKTTVDIIQAHAMGANLGREEVLNGCSNCFQDVFAHGFSLVRILPFTFARYCRKLTP